MAGILRAWTVAAAVFVFAASAPSDPGEEFPKGRIIQKVVTLHDPAQSYALYLPKDYTPDRKWPILYGYSPAGRGEDPVRVFQKAAEKYGWILVGSNNSRNGPWEPIRAAIEAVWKDTRARFSIDDSRIMAGGFSGGARVSFNMMAAVKGAEGMEVAAVFPCGAGFGSQGAPPEGSRTIVCGMAGRGCFNFPEMRLRTMPALKARRIRCRLLVFDGGHQWPPEDTVLKAARYVRMAMLCRDGKGDGKEAAELLREDLAEAEALLRDSGAGFYEGRDRLADLADMFKGCPAEKDIAARLAALEGDERVKKAKAAEDALKGMLAELKAIADGNERFDRMLERSREFSREYAGTPAALSLSAELSLAARAALMQAQQLLQRKDYPAAARLLERIFRAAPNDPTVAYNLACAQAMAGRREDALNTLAEAVRLGYGDLEHMKKDPDLDSLRSEEAYKKIVADLEKKAAGGGGR
ncbi:MAG: tetratricopeptide repeat protein [Planctomycetota bacterium]|nr:tetratricopeptide repeat protein [Planctomycetota bacterium]